tara:strand:+ start:724 stop:1665 length:942 start_codon:yes stop_codon:yes gene_type:complete
MQIDNIPWTEKYRPNCFGNIIFNKYSDQFFNNLIQNNYFPNLLLYGPPGTGKTTTIINLITKFQELYSKKSSSLVIHLNASDDRGIDIIRHNIFNFVKSNNLFDTGIKFVILDEVDYMTRFAQSALKSLMQEFNTNIRYCLICNYISKIDYSLQYEFIKVRFHKLPKQILNKHITNIAKIENININNTNIDNIITYYDTDIRSMLNYIQSNHSKNIISNNIFEYIYTIHKANNYNKFNKIIISTSINYNLNINFLIKKYVNYLISKFLDEKYENNLTKILSKKLIIYEYIIHNIDNIDHYNKNIYLQILFNSL